MVTTHTQTDFLSSADKERMIGHMNTDHSDTILDYVHAFVGESSAQHARLLDIGPDAMAVEYHTEHGSNICRIPFTTPLTSKDDVRPTLVKLAQLARERLAHLPTAQTTHPT